ncbi:DUF3857 domain-containing protein [Croceibacterium sp. TMG7-5b_MA50]|uniref:DUF3857 domain-containing protein n=1 Tax=Croceibacterium sp. TMG7-5b_MA50 TaxID=3121290 RepID=UPI00322157AD
MRFGGKLPLVSAAVMMWAAGAPALAGETVLYQPAPGWVEVASLPEGRSTTPLQIWDEQHRIEDGRLWSYAEQAVRIDSPQMLSAAGTLQASWLPDKGDLIIHRVAIMRGGEEIDVVAGGATFDVLRREMQLEQRSLDGARTATLAVPGLRVGDVLRLAFSITKADQTLDGEVQQISPLPAKPMEAAFGRLRMSWPENAPVRWQVSDGVTAPEAKTQGGFVTVELALPLAEPAPMPEDAPVRYRMPRLMQAGTFADWAEVSRIMAPLYATDGVLDSNQALTAQVAAIREGHAGELERAVAALRLVQDEIAYLANGMNGGNYMPQAPGETWTARYGDCKAKTVLLLTLLRGLGIEAEPVLVSSQAGDGLPGMLPLPGAFDHVIVRATVAGTDYWLDGTSSGASLAVVEEVPAFHHALPLRDEGADLIAMAQRPQTSFDQQGRVTFDHRAGLDLPVLVEGEWKVLGAAAGAFRMIDAQATEEQRKEFAQGFVSNVLGEAAVVDSAITVDSAANAATLCATALMTSPWRWERGRGSRSVDLPTSGFEFRPDRARSAWRDIPVVLPGPYWQQTQMTVLLPESGSAAYRLDGKDSFTQEIAGMRLARQATLDGSTLIVTDSAGWPGGELAPAAATEARGQASRFGSTTLTLRAPDGVERRFAFAGKADRTRVAPIEAAYAKLIADDPDEVEGYRNRARFRQMTYDFAGAKEDLTRVIDQEPDADTLLWRSRLHADLGEMELALADAEQAYELNGDMAAVDQRATLMRYMGQVEEAIALIHDYGGTSEEQRNFAAMLSDLDAQAGRKQEGLDRLDALLDERPDDPALLNARCWYQAIWDFNTQDLTDICTRALESADWSPPVLDSRGFANFRLGRLPEALKDLNAALAASPEMDGSLFMRGVVRREMGDTGGQADIAAALARVPSLKRYYALYGIEVD